MKRLSSRACEAGCLAVQKPLRWSPNPDVRRSFSTTAYERCKSNSILRPGWRASNPCRLSSHIPAEFLRVGPGPGRMASTLGVRLMSHRAFIALGSNLGDRVAMIEEACNRIDKDADMKIVRTSSLWETKAMYVEDQDKFVNGACEIRTSLHPEALLDRLQGIENAMGRVKIIDKGPRNIDLDILLYDTDIIRSERLNVPHQLMLEREFVLRPLCEMIPNECLPVPFAPTPLKEHLQALKPSNPPLSTLTPLSSRVAPLIALHPARKTHLMSILNVTPDSFSDGGVNDPTNSEQLRATILSHVRNGATIIDVGGQSTRPGAHQVSPEEEAMRLLPAVEHARSLPECRQLLLSVDTYRASVARAAVEAGADIVNDVSAGMLDPEMLPTVAKLGCTICLMHMRGDPSTMTKLTDYGPAGVVATVGKELRERVDAAEAAGIRRWRIVLDPGIGFAKTQTQNLELLRRLGDLRNAEGLRGLPWLVGSSRKGFVGKITGVREPKDRVMGSAVAVAAAIQGGADIVRVHDVSESRQVIDMADAIWRVEGNPQTGHPM